MNKIAKLSNYINLFAACVFYGLPVLSALLWFNLSVLPQSIIAYLVPFNATFVNSVADITKPLVEGYYVIISSTTQGIGFLLSMLPIGIVMLTLAKLRKLLTNYSKGEIFTLDNVMMYRSLALFIFASCLVDMIYIPLVSVGLTIWNPEGYRVVMASVGSPQIETLFIGSLVLLISWVMKEGFMMAEEQSGTV